VAYENGDETSHIGALDFVVADVQLGFSAAGIGNSFYNEHQSNYAINSI
jgi:hypothetical protein